MKLHKKIIALVSLVLISILSMYSYFNIASMKKQVLNQLEQSAKILAQSLEQSIITSGALEDRELLQKLVVDFNKVEGIHEVYVVDKNFRIIAHPAEDHIGQIYDNPDVQTAVKKGRQSTEYKNEGDEKLLDVVIPLTVNGQIKGAIEVELDFDKIEELIYSASIKAVYAIILTIVVLALVLVTLLFNIVVKPLNQLVVATNQVAAGTFKPVSCRSTRDEIGQLVCSFNEMCVSLQKLSERDRSSNPLTGLPGNIIIRQEIEKRLHNGTRFSLLYADLDHFKEFNDTFGFNFGDSLIKLTAETLQQALKEEDEPGSFIGHIGGDDFILLTDINRGEMVAEHIIEIFETRIGELSVRDSKINLSISVAHIKVNRPSLESAQDLCERAAELKKEVKKLPGSNFISE